MKNIGMVPKSVGTTLNKISRLRPADSAWPSAGEWAKLNDEVGGNLIKVSQFSDSIKDSYFACLKDPTPENPGCVDAFSKLCNPFWIGDQPDGTQNSGILDGFIPQSSIYAIKARNTADVVAGVNFAREHNLRLVVKGGAHSYSGTSNAPDSLLIWTRGMNKVDLHDAFIEAGSPETIGVPAVSIGSGAMWIDVYNTVTTIGGRYVQGGGCATVGVAGFIQAGGFGLFSKKFGTGAANLLEAEVVAADGRILIVNKYNYSDLFWAIKGGGGPTFGIVTRITLCTYDLPKFFGLSVGVVMAKTDEAFKRLITQFIEFYSNSLFNPDWGNEINVGADNTLSISLACCDLGSDEINTVWKPFLEWVNEAPNNLIWKEPFQVTSFDPRFFWDIKHNPMIKPDSRPGVPSYHGWFSENQNECGFHIVHYDSLWLPQKFLKLDQQKYLVDALFAATRYGSVLIHFNKGLAGARGNKIESQSINPNVFDAFGLAIFTEGIDVRNIALYPGLSTLSEQQLIENRSRANNLKLAANELRKITPSSGSYSVEGNYSNENWQQDYWGINYPKLRKIKDKYDPGGLFIIHHGVGSEDWSADGFSKL